MKEFVHEEKNQVNISCQKLSEIIYTQRCVDKRDVAPGRHDDIHTWRGQDVTYTDFRSILRHLLLRRHLQDKTHKTLRERCEIFSTAPYWICFLSFTSWFKVLYILGGKKEKVKSKVESMTFVKFIIGAERRFAERQKCSFLFISHLEHSVKPRKLISP